MKRFNILRNEAGDGEGGGGSGGTGGGGSQSLLTPGAGEGTSTQAPQAPAGQGSADAGSGAFDFRSLVGDDGKFISGFQDKLPDGLKEHGKHFAKYTDPRHVFEANVNLQQLLGQKANAVVIPDADAPPEAWAPVLKRLGVPDAPEGYNLKVPDKLPEGVSVNAETLKEFATFAHGIGLTPQQVSKLQEFDLGRATKAAGGSAEQAQAIEAQHFSDQKALLTKEWGNGAEATKKQALAERAALTFGFTPDEVTSDPLFRNARFVMTLAKAGAAMSEDTLVKGSDVNSAGGLKARAQDVISNEANPLYKKYWAGDEDTVNQVRNWMRSS